MTLCNNNFKVLYQNSGIPRRVFFGLEDCIFKLNRNKINVLYYKCEDKNCKAKGKIVDGEFFRTNVSEYHNHEKHNIIAEYQEAFDRLKLLAAEESKPLRPMHRQELRKLSLEAGGMLSWKKVRHTLQRIRRNLMPPCQNIEELIYLLEHNDSVHSMYGKLRDSFFYQGAIDDIMFFANMELVTKMDTSFSMFIDATFSIAPFNSRQLLVIMAELMGKPRAIVFVVMSEKTMKQYRTVFSYIRKAILSQDGVKRVPEMIMSDFEKGLRGAIKKEWPEAEITGCNFHFVQALRRKCLTIKSLSTNISKSPKHRYVLNLYMRLSLLPENRVRKGFKDIQNYIKSSKGLVQDFKEFKDYFVKTWFVSYKVKEWCVSSLKYRTNNHVEGFNNLMKKSIPLKPSPWTFLDGLLDIAYDSSSSFISDSMTTRRVNDRSRITVPLNKALLDLKLKRIDELKFLQRLAKIEIA